MDASQYCREIETYLCRKNEGHLIRIVGPAFERVCGWAARGVPLAIAFRGIDRYCERYYAKGPRRRPVRIEFCEADILDAFDDWRRAVGVTLPETDHETRAPRKASLPSHLDRVLVRLTSLSAMTALGDTFAAEIDALVAEIDRLATAARHARGEARSQIILRLAELDREMMAAAGRAVDPDTAAALRHDAVEELASFGPRMSAEARSRATEAAFERLVRDALKLPVIAFE
jgi:hypothetical protein